MNSVIRFALRYRLLIVVLSLVCLVYGGYLTTKLPIDVFPDLDRPRVVVMTECPGLAAEEVETLVTAPLESSILGASGVQDVRTDSIAGLSVVYVEFAWDTKLPRARQVVQERLAAVQPDLPADVRPQMTPTSSIMGQILHVGMHYRPGPRGGTLAPVGVQSLLAELTQDPKTGSVSVALWKPVERNNPQRWEAVRLDDEPIVLTWTEPGATDARTRAETLQLQAEAAGTGAFGSHPSLARDRAAFEELDRQVSLRVAGQKRTVHFPGQTRRLMNLRTTADWVLRPRLRKIAGIAQVTVMGGGRKQYQVLVNLDALREFDVDLGQVEEAIRRNNPSASGGFAEAFDREFPIRILSRLGSSGGDVLEDIRRIPVKKSNKRTVLLGQVARVVEGPQLKRGDATVNGHAGIVLTVFKQPHGDTRQLSDEVVRSIREAERSLSADIVVEPELFQMKNFIDRGIFNVGEALVIGAVLVLIVLFLFLLNFRTTFISLTAIPLSLVLTTLVFRLIGWLTGTQLSINVMTLGGIAVAMGELVDDAVVDVENIFRRLRENAALPEPRPALTVVYEASIEVRGAIVFGTAMVVLVFLPLFALSGVEGRLFSPLGVAYIVSILASLLVSLTVTPVLSSFLLPNARATHRQADSPLLRGLKWGAGHLVRFSMAHAGLLLLASWLLVGLAFLVLMGLGASFLPPFDEGSVQVNVMLPSGSSLQASNEMCAAIDRKFQSMRRSPENPHGLIVNFVRRTGRAELDEHVDPVNSTEYILSINPAAAGQRNEILKQVLEEVKNEGPGVSVETEQPLQHLISHMLSGVTAQIAIKIYGDDLNVLRRTAEQIQHAIKDVPGLTAPVIEASEEVPELHIRLKPAALAYQGVDRDFVAHFVQTGLRGETVSQIIEGQRRFDLVVRLEDRFRTNYSRLGELRLELPHNGGRVKLSELAEIVDGVGPNVVKRENARRRLAIRCNAQDRDLVGVVADLQTRIRERVTLPEGYFVELGGQFEAQRRATLLIGILAGVALVGMFVVLYMAFPSTRIVLQVLNALPTAFIGGVLALALTNQRVTVAALVGFISLGGIAVRNGILLVTHYLHLMQKEGESFTESMIVRGSLERLAPVLMTALTAGIALIPLVLGGQQPGREVLYPVATVILGGLITSTLCEFLIHPGLFWRFSGKDADRLVRRSEPAA